MATMAAIDEFLSLKRIALVGVSRNEEDFSRVLFRELAGRGYDVVPVNPNAAEIEGRPCFSNVVSIEPHVQGVLVMTPANLSASVVKDCADANISRVWLHRGAGLGAVSPEAVALAKTHKMTVIDGECPFMFLKDTAWFHNFHRGWRKITGRYPLAAQALLSL